MTEEEFDSTQSEESVPNTADGRTGLSRRSCLKGVAAAGFAATALTTSASASHSSIPHSSEFGTVVDVVDRGYVSNDGNRSITGGIRRALGDHGDDTLLYFPAGRYYIDREVVWHSFENVGFVGERDDDGENLATFAPATYDGYDAQGHSHRMFRLGKPERWYGSPGNRLVFEGFDVDFTPENTGLRVVEADVYDGLEVRDIDIYGRHDTGAYGPGRFAINSSDGDGIVEAFRAPDGGEFTANANTGSTQFYGPPGILSNQYHEGTLTYRDCEIDGFPNSGIYAVGGSGSLHVEGGSYRNSNVAQLRLGGGTGSTVRDTTLVVDEKLQSSSDPVRQRALRFEGGATDLTVENVDIEMTSNTAIEAILVKQDVSGLTMRDLDMDLQADKTLNGIRIRGGSGSPSDVTIESASIDHSVAGGTGILIDDAGSNPGPLTVQDVTFTGSPGIGGGRAAIYNRRDDAVFRNVTVDQNGHPKRNGVVDRGSNTSVSNVD